jgi:protein TonB
MTTNALVADALSNYGAPEIKGAIKQNTVRGYIVAASLILLLLLLYFAYVMIMLSMKPEYPRVKLTKVSLENLGPPPSDNADAPPPPPPTTPPPAAGPAARAGAPVPVPDAELAPDVKDFANVDQINRASAVGGSGEDFGGFADNIGQGVNIESREDEPGLEDFQAVEKEPGFDYASLQKSVKYPDLARRNNIEGQVIVAALIGKDGKIIRTQVTESDHELLNDEAVKAVMRTSFTPAIQNGNPVTCWVRIPIRFRLR